jgi:hypothetical protein
MGGGNAGLGGDFVVLIKQEQPNQPRAWVETLAETSDAAPASLGVMVSLYPDIKSLDCDNDPKFNFVFVIDRCVCVSCVSVVVASRECGVTCVVGLCRSGSMSGSRVEAAKRTLQLCLRSLPLGCVVAAVHV